MGFKPRPLRARPPADPIATAVDLVARGHHAEATAVMHTALVDLGFGETRVKQADGNWLGTPQPVPQAEQLTPAQLAIAQQLARVEGISVADIAIPPSAWCRRRWLGIDPGGVLERTVDFEGEALPLWRALSILQARNAFEDCHALISSLGLSKLELLELFTDIQLGAYRLRVFRSFHWGPMGFEPFAITEVAAEHEQWALSTLQRITRLFGDSALRCERGDTDEAPSVLCWLVMAVLVETNTPVVPDWERFVRAAFQPANYVELTKCVLRLVPAERRAPVLIDWLQTRSAKFAVDVAMAHLQDVPSKSLVELVLSRCDQLEAKKKRSVLAELSRLSPKVVGIRGPLARYNKRRKPPLQLKILRRFTPASVFELNDSQRRQLERAGALYDGQQLSASRRLTPGGDEHSFHGYLKIVELGDGQGKHVFDLFEYNVDSGSIFKAGTTDEVAGIIQFGLECTEPKLKEALQLVLEDYT